MFSSPIRDSDPSKEINTILHAAGVDSATYKSADRSTREGGTAGEGGPILVSYCTDVEGNYDYWQRFLGLSKTITRLDKDGKQMNIPYQWTGRNPSAAMSVVSNSSLNSINIAKAYGGRYPDPVYPPYSRLSLKPNCHFVFGGDVTDRGPGDIRVLWDLLQLYEDHPGRVHFIMGNRDVNKLRLPTELHDCYLRKPGATYWIPNDPEQRPQNASERLKWILARTMGSPDGFEHRRTELKQIIVQQRRERAAQRKERVGNGKFSPMLGTGEDSGDEDDDMRWDVNNRYATEKVKVSDEEVVQSYFDLLFPPGMGKSQGGTSKAQLAPQGLLLKYMAYAQLVLRIEDNLFVHGGLNENNIGWVAPQNPYKKYEDQISATGAMVMSGAGALGGGMIPVLPSYAKNGDLKEEEKDGTGESRVSRRSTFDAWCSEANWRASIEVRDFAENTRMFVLGLNTRHPNSPANNRNLFGKNKYDANYTATALDATTPAHWAITGTYDHPQPGSRLVFQGMAVAPDKVRNPSMIYSGYTTNGMPVNIDKYEGTVIDETGKIIADASRGENLASMLQVHAGSMLKARKVYVKEAAMAKEDEGEESSSSDDDELSKSGSVSLTSDVDHGVANNPAVYDKAVVSTLLKSNLYMTPQLAGTFVRDLGVNRVFCGHQPHGDAPLTINITVPDSDEAKASTSGAVNHRRLQIIVADTSYSANTQWNWEPVIKPKTGNLILWNDDWKPISMERLRAENEDREKMGGEEDTIFSADEDDDLPEIAEGKENSDSKLAASAKAAQAKGNKAIDSKAGAIDDSKTGYVKDFSDAKESKDKDPSKKTGIKSMTPQMTVNEEDNVAYNNRPLKLWNLDAIQTSLNTRGIAVSEVLCYVPLFTGVGHNESVSEANSRRSTATSTPSRVFMHGLLSDGSTYAFEQPAPEYSSHLSEDVYDGSKPPVDKFIGKSTRSGGWVVKAYNVVAKHNINIQHTRHLPSSVGEDRAKGLARATAEGVSTQGEKIYLLSRGEGFSFRNKFVAASDMEEEMNA